MFGDDEEDDRKKKPSPSPSPSPSPDSSERSYGKAMNQGSKDYFDPTIGGMRKTAPAPMSAADQGQALRAGAKTSPSPSPSPSSKEPERGDYNSVAEWRAAKLAWMKSKESQ